MDKKLILHGTLIDGNGGTPLEDSAILIFGERIEKVCAFSEMENIEDAEIIDASGKYIIPGLIEGHAHTTGYRAVLKMGHTTSLPYRGTILYQP